jgi:hypothetical protein
MTLRKITSGISILLIGIAGYLFLFGKLFALSPVIAGLD